MSCQNITHREDFQRQLEDMNPDAAVAIKRMVEAELLLKKRRGPLHPSTEEEIRQAAEVCASEHTSHTVIIVDSIQHIVDAV